MKAGTENRNKTIAAGVLGMCAVLGVGYMLYSFLGGGPAAPPPTAAPVTRTMGATNAALEDSARTNTLSGNTAGKSAVMPTGNAAGVPAKKIATSSASLDPTLDETAMLRTERLVYSGTGRNIFSATYSPPLASIPVPVSSVRKTMAPPPPPAPTGPPPPPPINLKFFGTATRANGTRQAFLLQGDDVFLAGQGDIVARRYKIVSVASNSIQVEDMANNNTQTLPLQSN